MAEKELLSKTLILRITETDYQRYESLYQQSDCASIAEVVRRILSGKKIVLFQQDASRDVPMEQLTAIADELKAIGRNVNQLTRSCHSSRFSDQQVRYVEAVADSLQPIMAKMNEVLVVTAALSAKWLQK